VFVSKYHEGTGGYVFRALFWNMLVVCTTTVLVRRLTPPLGDAALGSTIVVFVNIIQAWIDGSSRYDFSFATNCTWGYDPVGILVKWNAHLPLFPPYMRVDCYSRWSWLEHLTRGYHYRMAILTNIFAVFLTEPGRKSSDSNKNLYTTAIEEEATGYERFQWEMQNWTHTVPVYDFATRNYDDCTIDLANDSLGREDSPNLSLIHRKILCEWQDLVDKNQERRRAVFNTVPRQNPLTFTERNTSITLATQGSADRLDQLINIVERWSGPVSVAVYVKSNEIGPHFIDYYRNHATQLVS